MDTANNSFAPDYAVPPGWVLGERLDVMGLSHAEFARRCGRSAKLISEIIAGKAPLEPETALQFERVLGVDASIWLGIEAAYQLHQARQVEAESAERAADWVKAFPIRDMVKRGLLEPPASDADAVPKLLSFFGVASISAWSARYDNAAVAYRHSPSFASAPEALATWLRAGELVAADQTCAPYDASRFRKATGEIRALTVLPLAEALSQAKDLCNAAGVALAVVPPFQKTALSGAAWWLSPSKAVIQLTARHKTDDHLWFSFFHEAAHILLHSKKSVFIDDRANETESTDIEDEANQWANDALIPKRSWSRFVATEPRSEQAVRSFAGEIGIAPGIVVGRLQNQGFLPWTHLNGLKRKLDWNAIK